MYLNQIPGYGRAIARADRIEDHWRERAFLGLTETLRFGSGRSLEVLPLSLRAFLELSAVRSPFVVGGDIRPEHIAQVLWRLSSEYSRSDRSQRTIYLESIMAIPFLPAIRAINRFLDRMLIDRPPSKGGNDGSKADTSFAAALVHMLANAYGWDDDL